MISRLGTVAGAESPDGKMAWSPQLDLRNCGFDMIRHAIGAFATAQWEPWFADYMEKSGLGEVDLSRTCEAFTRAVDAYAQGGDPPRDIGECLIAEGYFAEPLPCQLALAAKLGQVAVGFFAYALRYAHALEDGGLSYKAALDRLVEGGAAIAASLSQTPTHPIDRLGLGLRLLRPYAIDAGGNGGVCVDRECERPTIDCRPGVPADVEQRLRGLGWTMHGPVGNECTWSFDSYFATA